MPRRALVENRPWLLAAITAALAFYFLRENSLAGLQPIGGTWLILLKGAAVGSLALYALRRCRAHDAWILAAALALSALGDMAIELWFEAGGALFFASHLAALSLYLRNLRPHPTSSQKALGVALLIATPLACWQISGSGQVGLYGLALGGMAAAAWMSRFPRYRVGTGAVLFVFSDLLLFAGSGPLQAGVVPDLLVWPLYFSGQFLIATGVIQTLRRDHQA
ncbi:MAG: hypothetical protein APF82_03435 [Sphingomonadales bacterium BRH_c42]|nr:MAG: hypothetical protein APF82_03435 [Sphingomonadales bacterium BRH_c42]